jgi:hypothetical protein
MPAPAVEPIDGVVLRNRNPAQPTTNYSEQKQRERQKGRVSEMHILLHASSPHLDSQQYALIIRKLSARAPRLSITDYLARIHRYCPMTTGVYLAASLYIHRQASAAAVVVVTSRSAHRLALAALSVARKALEDGSGTPAQELLARVGGVGIGELGRMELYFCFLAGFRLSVRGPEMWEHYEWLREGTG